MAATYLDSSAIVRLALREAESLALRRYLGQDLGAIVTYDDRMAEAAKHIGHRVVMPR